jgi:hypothetical protein
MNLRQAAEMALKYFEDAHGLEDAGLQSKKHYAKHSTCKPLSKKALRRGQMFLMQPSG